MSSVRPSFQSRTKRPAQEFKKLVVLARQRDIGELQYEHRVTEPINE